MTHGKPNTRQEAPPAPPDQDDALKRYVSDLKAKFGQYARPASEARKIVDESMGESSLTGLLYKSRENGENGAK